MKLYLIPPDVLARVTLGASMRQWGCSSTVWVAASPREQTP